TRGLDTIERIVRQQAQLVNDLLDVSRIVAGKLLLQREPLAMAGLARDVAQEGTLLANAKGVTLQSRIEDAGTVLGDAGRLRQVLENLLSNAIKFTPRGGDVTLSCWREGGEAVAEVRDTGEGIAADFLPHLFERFTQEDAGRNRQHGGLGLGLAIVRHLTAMHGGTVAAAS